MEHLRTYLRRSGRMTKGQSRALDLLTPKLSLDIATTYAFGPEVFHNTKPLYVEIGFGMGQGLVDWASKNPDVNFVGIEVYRPGIGSLMSLVEEAGLTNVRVLEGTAEEVIQQCFQADSIEELRIMFPDPWPKKKHHKRRLIQKSFVDTLLPKLVPAGRLRIATDWQPYSEWIIEVLAGQQMLVNQSPQGNFVAATQDRIVTKFEARGLRLGHQTWEMLFAKQVL